MINEIVNDLPVWLKPSYEVRMGSHAYGCNNKYSDVDVYGFCIPPKEYNFPPQYIRNFGPEPQNFHQYQKNHIQHKGTGYDFTIYNIVKYFDLTMNANPNMIDSLFVSEDNIFHIDDIGKLVRENRDLFLSKKIWHTYKGYAYSQLNKIRKKENTQGKRKELIDLYGYDVKFAYHVVRLVNQAEQMLLECDLDLYRNREQLKDIRSGNWTLEEIQKYFADKEASIKDLYLKSDLPHTPRVDEIKALLIKCLEIGYEEKLFVRISIGGNQRKRLERVKEEIDRVIYNVE